MATSATLSPAQTVLADDHNRSVEPWVIVANGQIAPSEADSAESVPLGCLRDPLRARR